VKYVEWRAGTAGYFPPEYPKMSQAGDVWSLGVTVHYCATGETVRDTSDLTKSDSFDWMTAELRQINIHNLTVPPKDRKSNGENMASWPTLGVYSPTLDHFLERMLTLDPEERPSAGVLLRDMEDVHDQITQFGKDRNTDFDAAVRTLPLVVPRVPTPSQAEDAAVEAAAAALMLMRNSA
jgi:serine/threonine protein kinase